MLRAVLSWLGTSGHPLPGHHHQRDGEVATATLTA